MLCSDNIELIPLDAAGEEKFFKIFAFSEKLENSQRDRKNLANEISSKP